jgi:hypothetical protein
MPHDEELREAYIAGFMKSTAGWNGEKRDSRDDTPKMLDIGFRAFMRGLDRRRRGDFREVVKVVIMEATDNA